MSPIDWTGATGTLRALWRVSRPYQWVKNGFVLVGLLFSHAWSDGQLVLDVLTVLAAFCLASSAVYCLNDVLDRHADRAHPDKRTRPVASGAIGVRLALAWAMALLTVALYLAAEVSTAALTAIALYALLNLGYSAGLKHVAILDVFLIAGGFMLRIVAGTVGVDIEPSRWLLGCGMLLTLFLGFAKRRAELSGLRSDRDPVLYEGRDQRRSLESYSTALLDPLIWTCAAGAAISYSLYTLDAGTVALHGTPNLIWTLPFVLYGLFRYLYSLYALGSGADPAGELMRDPHLWVTALCWLTVTAWLLH